MIEATIQASIFDTSGNPFTNGQVKFTPYDAPIVDADGQTIYVGNPKTFHTDNNGQLTCSLVAGVNYNVVISSLALNGNYSPYRTPSPDGSPYDISVPAIGGTFTISQLKVVQPNPSITVLYVPISQSDARYLGINATASWSKNAVSASYAPGSPSVSASYAQTASYALNGGAVASGPTTQSVYATSSIYAQSASYVSSSVHINNADTASYLSASLALVGFLTASGQTQFNSQVNINAPLRIFGNNGLVISGTGNLGVGGFSSLDNGSISTDGNGHLTAVGITSSLYGTASWSSNANSSSYVSSSSGTVLALKSRTITAVSGVGQLIDTTTLQSLDWQNRSAFDTSGGDSIDWQNRFLVDSTGNDTIDWNNKYLYDSFSKISVDWTKHVLSGSWSTSGSLTVSSSVNTPSINTNVITASGGAFEVNALGQLSVQSAGVFPSNASYCAAFGSAIQINGATAGFQLADRANNNNIMQYYVNNGIWNVFRHGFGLADANIFSISASGQVGIGTTSITNSLDVVGNISCSVITASLLKGTASYASNALTASYALTGTGGAGVVSGGSYNISSSYASGSNTVNVTTTLADNAYPIVFTGQGNGQQLLNTDGAGNLTWEPNTQTLQATYLSISGSPELFNTSPVIVTNDVNNYNEINIQNKDKGANASSDLVATSDVGTAATYYVDVGINNSNYTGGFIGQKNDAYLYNTGSDLYIGTATANKNLYLFTGGTSNTSSVMISNGGQISCSAVTASNIGYALMFAAPQTTMARTSSYYVNGNTSLALVAGSTRNRNRMPIPMTGTIRSMYFVIDNNVVDTAANMNTMSFQINGNDISSSNNSVFFAQNIQNSSGSGTGMNLAVNAGDALSIKFTTANYTTIPTNTYLYGHVWISTP